MRKIYELDISLFNKVYMYPTSDKFIFTKKNKRPVVVVDNTSRDFFMEDFSNKTKGLIFLVNEDFLNNDVEEEYKNNKNKYKNYKKIVSSQNDYFLDKDLGDLDFLSFVQQNKYEFNINIGNCSKKIKSKIIDAIALANNFESDLFYNNHLIYSPLGFEWDYNNKLIHKYLGITHINEKGINLPYRNLESREIEVLDMSKEIKF